MRQKSLKLNFIMNAILTMSQFIFPLITFPYVSRILLPEGTGKVSFATSVISYFAMNLKITDRTVIYVYCSNALYSHSIPIALNSSVVLTIRNSILS